MKWEKVKLKGVEGGGRGRKGGTAGPGKRWGHTCNALKHGRSLYVFGGYGKDNRQTNDVHVFDTVKQTWSKPVVKGTPPSPRDSHTSTTVGTSLYVFGGTDGKNALQDLYILDTVTNTWAKPQVSGNGPACREGHSAALIGLSLFIFGGCGKTLDEAEEMYFNDLYILDTARLHWTKAVTKGTPPVPRDSHTCSSWGDKLIVLGGEDASDSYLADVQILHTDVMEWKELQTSGQQLMPRAGHVTIAVGKHLFVFGGFTDDRKLFDDLHMLNLETGVWSKVIADGAGPSRRFSIAGDCIGARSGGILAFIGGCNDNLEALDDMYYLDTELQSEKTQEERPEKYSLRKELKRKRQETQPLVMKRSKLKKEVQQPPFVISKPPVSPNAVISASVSASPVVGAATVRSSFYEFKPPEEKIFEAKIVDAFHYGYTIESDIDGKKLRGLLFCYKPGFAHAVHAYLTRKKLLLDGTANTAKDDQKSKLNSAHLSMHDASSLHGPSYAVTSGGDSLVTGSAFTSDQYHYLQPKRQSQLQLQPVYQQHSHFLYQNQVPRLHEHASVNPYHQDLFSNHEQSNVSVSAPSFPVPEQDSRNFTGHGTWVSSSDALSSQVPGQGFRAEYGTWGSSSEAPSSQVQGQSAAGFAVRGSFLSSQGLSLPSSTAPLHQAQREEACDSIMQGPSLSQVTSLHQEALEEANNGCENHCPSSFSQGLQLATVSIDPQT